MTAVFYDLENILLGIPPGLRKYFRLRDMEALVRASPEVGDELEQRAYCSWPGKSVRPVIRQMEELGIARAECRKPAYLHRERRVIKNFSDMFIFMDALDMAHTRPDIDCFVFVSRDSDFGILCERLYGMGKRALRFKDGFGLPPSLFRPKVVAEVKPKAVKVIGELVRAATETHRGVQDFDQLLGLVLKRCGQDACFREAVRGGGVNISTIFGQMRNGKQGVSYKTSGQKKMPQAFAQAVRDGGVYCVCERDGQYFLMARETAPEDLRVVEPEAGGIEM